LETLRAGRRISASTTGGPKRLRAHQPLDCCALFQLCRKVFEASRLNLCVRVSPALFPGKGNLKVSLWKAVHGCAKAPNRKMAIRQLKSRKWQDGASRAAFNASTSRVARPLAGSTATRGKEESGAFRRNKHKECSALRPLRRKRIPCAPRTQTARQE